MLAITGNHNVGVVHPGFYCRLTRLAAGRMAELFCWQLDSLQTRLTVGKTHESGVKRRQSQTPSIGISIINNGSGWSVCCKIVVEGTASRTCSDSLMRSTLQALVPVMLQRLAVAAALRSARAGRHGSGSRAVVAVAACHFTISELLTLLCVRNCLWD